MKDLRMGLLGIASFGVALGAFMTALVNTVVLQRTDGTPIIAGVIAGLFLGMGLLGIKHS